MPACLSKMDSMPTDRPELQCSSLLRWRGHRILPEPSEPRTFISIAEEIKLLIEQAKIQV